MRRWRGLLLALSMLLLGAAHSAAQAAPQSTPLSVIVDGQTYVVNGATVSRKTGTQPIDNATNEKARFTARILDEQILRSPENKQRYSALNRAIVFSNAMSDKLVEPWMKLLWLGGSPENLESANQQFKAWVSRLAADPAARKLAIIQKDYFEGIRAFRENAGIYRNVTKRNELLTYDQALRFFQNAEKLQQASVARKLEETLPQTAAVTPSDQAKRLSPTPAPAQAPPPQTQASPPSQGPQLKSPQDGSPAPVQGDPKTQPNQVSSDPATLQDKLNAASANPSPTAEGINKAANDVSRLVDADVSVRSDPALREYVDSTVEVRDTFQRQAQAYRQGIPNTDGGIVPSTEPASPARDEPWQQMFNSFVPPGAPPPPRYASPPVSVQRPRPPGVPAGTSQNTQSTITTAPQRPGIPTGTSQNTQSTITGTPQSPTENSTNSRSGIINLWPTEKGTTQNPQPTATGTYQPVTVARAGAIVRTYRSIPGGLTVEGGSPDLSFVEAAVYEPRANAFILNDDVVYLSPVSQKEFVEICRALAVDDKLGVSYGRQLRAIVYGKLPPEGVVVKNLKLADLFLSGLALSERMMGYLFAPGYEGKEPATPWTGTVYWNVNDIRFKEEADGELRRSGVKLAVTLVPLSGEKAPDGGNSPDFARINSGDIPREYVANVTNIKNNVDYYARERIVRIAFAYAEAAAFVRGLKTRGVNLEQFTRSIEAASAKR